MVPLPRINRTCPGSTQIPTGLGFRYLLLLALAAESFNFVYLLIQEVQKLP